MKIEIEVPNEFIENLGEQTLIDMLEGIFLLVPVLIKSMEIKNDECEQTRIVGSTET